MSRVKLTALVLAGALSAGTLLSGADYTASSQNPGATFNAAPSFYLSVSLNAIASPLKGQVTVQATASDTVWPITSVAIERSPKDQGTWTEVCTGSVAPYDCPLDTTALADGRYDFRAVATNSQGQTKTSATVGDRHIDNGLPSVSLTSPAAWSRGTITLSSDVQDATGGTGITQVVYEFRTGAGAFAPACTANSAPFTCSFNTSAMTTGTAYDFRAIATDGNTNSTTSTVLANRKADSTVPAAVTLTDPATVTGNELLQGSATDTAPQSGIASLTFEYAPTGTSSWTTACVDSTSPFASCTFDSTTAADGQYDWRMVAEDVAGNTANSAVRSNRRLDNTAPSASLGGVGTYARGTLSLTSTASDPNSGTIANVTFQRSPAGAGTWTNICAADTLAPYTCSWNSTGVTDGMYDVRAIATDSVGITGSTIVTTRVDNTLPSASLTSPPAIMTGPHTLQATADDTGSGLTSVTIQMRPAGGSWASFCTSASSPLNCPIDTTGYADGLYEFRVVADDAAGNTRTTTAVTNRRIDNNAPTVTMTDPGAWMRGTVTLASTTGDGTGSGINNVRYEYKLTSGSTWTTACTGSSSPFSCALNTTTLTDGEHYDFRAIATDNAGFTTTSAVRANRGIDNTAPAATMNDPGLVSGAAMPFSGVASDAYSGVASVRFEGQYSGTWYELCTDSDGAAPWTCNADTTVWPGGTYNVRAIATDVAGNTVTSAVIANRTFDNTAPTTGFVTPPQYMKGTVTLTASPSDGASGSGIASVAFLRSPAGANTWTTMCTDNTAPYDCAFDTTGVSEGLYDIRAVATDNAGLTGTTTSTNRRVDNTAPSGSFTDPGATLTGTPTLNATGTDTGGSGVANVTFQWAPAGSGTWTNACTPDTSSPYSCTTWNTHTGTTPDGSYDLRALVTDNAGNQTPYVYAGRQIDNGPRAVDIQTANVGATPGRAETDDTITFTYSEAVDPVSILSGWNGSQTAVTVFFDNNGGSDRLQIKNAGNTAQLPLTLTTGTTANFVALNANHVTADATFTGQMTMSGSSVTVTLQTLTGTTQTAGAANMTWNPSTLATDLGGRAASPTALTEPNGGTADADF